MQKWITIIDECSKSDLSVKTWCNQNDISEQSYYYWLKKIRTQVVQKVSNKEISFSSIPIQSVMRTS
ncbi:MAG: IS66 family insertion sequence element accessory protein TnpB, partial [Bacilli bacterium]